jgi:hypothetical protein
MNELNERMRGVDQVPFRDDWDKVQQRAGATEPMRDPGGRNVMRAVAILVATLVVLGATLYGLSGLGSSTSGPAASPAGSELASYVNPMGIPITVDYPSDWYAQSVSQDSNPDPSKTGRPQIGLVVSNAPEAMPSPGDDSPSPGPLPDDPDLPSTFVTVTIIHVADPCGTSGDPCHPGLLTPNSPPPLSMSDAQVAPGPANIRILEATVAMHHLTISVHAGPEASTSDLAAADAIVASIRPTNAETASPTGSQEPSESATDKQVFAKGSDPLAGSWVLFTEETDFGPVFGLLIPGQQTFTTELKPLGDRTFGTWSLTGVSGNTLLLAQVVAPSVTNAEIRLDDGSVIDGELVDLPSGIIGPARVFVAGFSSVMSVEGQHLDPNGYVVAYGQEGQELARRRLASG